MKRSAKFCGLAFLFICFSKPTFALTREELLTGCKVPERRVLPVSKTQPPCADFYQYVCSETTSKFKLPADRSNWNFAFTDAAERLLCAKKQFFKKLQTGYKPIHEHAKPVKDYYLACMNVKASAAEEKKFVKEETTTILGLSSNEALADLAQQRIDAPRLSYLGFDTYADQDNPTREDVLISADLKTLPEPSYYQKPEVVKALQDIAVELFKAIGVDQPEQRAKWAVDFEKALAEKYPPPATIRDRISSNTYLDRAEWTKKYSHLKLDRFIANLPKDVRMRDFVHESLEFFDNAIQKMPLDQLKSALLFHSAIQYMDDAYPGFFKKYFAFNHKYLGGPEKRPDRQERCTKEAMRHFGMEIDEELIPIMFPNFPADRVKALAGKIRSSILKGLDDNTWLSAEAKTEAKRKISSARLFLIKPETESQWNFNYVGKYDPTKPYSNRELWGQLNVKKELDELAKPRDQDRWDMGPLTLNAYYSAVDNKFVLLQGILQYPFFDPAQSDIENMGAIGAVMGHELGHSIDDKGSRYNADGKLKQWMSPKDLEEFNKRGNIFVQRFDKIGHNGHLTEGESIGDHVGLSFAYAAAFPDPEKTSKEDKQHFFTAYARLWCQVIRPQFQEFLIKTDPHPMGFGRVDEQVIHQTGFYDAYSCKDGDKMFLPKDQRAKVW